MHVLRSASSVTWVLPATCTPDDAGNKAKRALLSLHVARMNAELTPDTLEPGQCLPACVRAVEDHGYTLTLGIPVSPCIPLRLGASINRLTVGLAS